MINNINAGDYSGDPMTFPFDGEQMARFVRDYEIMVLSGLDAILRRCELTPDYGFVDTKFSLATGYDFPADDPVRGRDTIYGWIQGRALESLAGHYAWLQESPSIGLALRNELSGRIKKVLVRLTERLEQLRGNNGGRLFFIMSPEGKTLKLDERGEVTCHEFSSDAAASFSDLFYAKGLAASAKLIDDSVKLAEARRLFARVVDDIEKNKFVSDQQPLDPKNSATSCVAGRHSLGPRMIAIGGASVFLQSTGDPLCVDVGLRFIDYILQYHADLTGVRCQRYDVWEYVDDVRRPYVDSDGILLSDPGHVCEFVGLSLKFLRLSESLFELSNAERSRFKDRRDVLVEILKKNFSNGFSSAGLGIGKSFDLSSRRMVNSDMPWWSLPETMRASWEACRVASSRQSSFLREIAVKSSNSFLRYYVKPEVHLMAVQTLNERGQISSAIPATPDADPAYHTGLSIIDCLCLCGEKSVFYDKNERAIQ